MAHTVSTLGKYTITIESAGHTAEGAQLITAEVHDITRSCRARSEPMLDQFRGQAIAACLAQIEAALDARQAHLRATTPAAAPTGWPPRTVKRS
jgi:hypothetical protein